MQSVLFPQPETVDVDKKRAYVVRGLDLAYYTKREYDGKIVARGDDRTEAVQNAKALGYHFNY